MTDKPKFIYQKQYEIIAAKPIEERVRLGLETIDDTRKMVEDYIKYQNPEMSKIDLKIAVFVHFYSDIFSSQQLDLICNNMRAYDLVH